MGYIAKKDWHAFEKDLIFDETNSSNEGLSKEEAQNRLKEHGPNKIERKSTDSPLTVLWRQINNPLIWVLIASGLIAVLLGKITDGSVVLAVVVINTIIGFVQEFKAGKAIEALSEMVPENAIVIRNGQKISIHAAEIVPGDVVLLKAGERVPADMRIIKQKKLKTQEAALTGESVPAQKDTESVEKDAPIGDRKCMVFKGTLVSTGTATGVAVATGMDTELGKISDMLEQTTDLETPLTKKLAVVANYFTIGIMALTVVILAVGILRSTGEGIAFFTALKDSLIFAIALAVGAIPEGLPAVVTIALAIGVRRMAKRKAIIRKLPSVETLGSTTVICSDKTGTLTKNEMTVKKLWTPKHKVKVSGVGYNKDGKILINEEETGELPDDIANLIENAVLCTDANIKSDNGNFKVAGDPTEVALLVAGAKAGIDTNHLRKEHKRIDSIPFDSDLKFMGTLNKKDKNEIIILKGAPEVILEKCDRSAEGTEFNKDIVYEEIEDLAKQGMRVLAVCQKNHDSKDGELENEEANEGFEFTGLIGMIDPPREEAVESIKSCHQAGINVKMITGDHKETASAIGKEIGLTDKGEAVTGTELKKMNEDELTEIVKTNNVFARVEPKDKLSLVKALQKNKHITAMTGDGVNDAPSLKQSNIGVAMGITGTSVAKEAADIVLADDNFASIGSAVEEGRRVYDNLLKSLAFILPTNLGLAFILVYGIIFFPFNPQTNDLLLPMLPTQLLWINMVAAVALALPLAFEVKEPNVMKRPPRNPEEPLFNKFVTFRLVFVSLLMTAGTIILFHLQYDNVLAAGFEPQAAQSKAQTTTVTFVIFFQIFYMLNCRSLKDSLTKIGFFTNNFIYIGMGTVLLLHAVFIYAPFMQSIFDSAALKAYDLLLALIFGFAIFPIIGIEKWIHSKLDNKQ